MLSCLWWQAATGGHGALESAKDMEEVFNNAGLRLDSAGCISFATFVALYEVLVQIPPSNLLTN